MTTKPWTIDSVRAEFIEPSSWPKCPETDEEVLVSIAELHAHVAEEWRRKALTESLQLMYRIKRDQGLGVSDAYIFVLERFIALTDRPKP